MPKFEKRSTPLIFPYSIGRKPWENILVTIVIDKTWKQFFFFYVLYLGNSLQAIWEPDHSSVLCIFATAMTWYCLLCTLLEGCKCLFTPQKRSGCNFFIFSGTVMHCAGLNYAIGPHITYFSFYKLYLFSFCICCVYSSSFVSCMLRFWRRSQSLFRSRMRRFLLRKACSSLIL